MELNFLTTIFAECRDEQALVYGDAGYTYEWLMEKVRETKAALDEAAIAKGSVVALRGDFFPSCIATLLALIEQDAIIVPIAPTSNSSCEDFLRIGEVEFILTEHPTDQWRVARTEWRATHPLYGQLRAASHPGMVLFSSGSTGDPKGATHDMTRLLKKYQVRRRTYRTLAFLLFDHIGGFDTLFQVLSNGSTLIVPADRTPGSVCKAVETHHVEVLPVAPSFLNALALSETYRRYDLTSLKCVTYGAELMAPATLEKCVTMFPGVQLLQKYGATEVGTLRSKSRDSGSLWVRVGGEGYQTRIVDGMLEVKAASSMLGYLNAGNPFTADGWFRTGDHVDVNGEYIRFLGRHSDIINVGGRKVYPGEVEAVINEVANVAEVVVYGRPNALLGNVVWATVRTVVPEEQASLDRRVRKHCMERLADYKIPMAIRVSQEALSSIRYKLLRPRSSRGNLGAGEVEG